MKCTALTVISFCCGYLHCFQLFIAKISPEEILVFLLLQMGSLGANWLYVIYTLNFNQIFPNVFHRAWVHFHPPPPPQQHVRVPISPHPYQPLVQSDTNFCQLEECDAAFLLTQVSPFSDYIQYLFLCSLAANDLPVDVFLFH